MTWSSVKEQSLLIELLLINQDNNGTGADLPSTPAMLAIRMLRQWFPDLLIAADVCLCPYTCHGHCGMYWVVSYYLTALVGQSIKMLKLRSQKCAAA